MSLLLGANALLQFKETLAVVVLGIVLGIIFGMIENLKTDRFLRFVLDSAYIIFCGIVFLIVMQIINNAKIEYWHITLFIIAFVVFKMLVSKISGKIKSMIKKDV